MAYWWGSPPFTSIQTGGVVVTPRDFTYISFYLFYCPYKNIYGLGVGIWTVYKIIAHSKIEWGGDDLRGLPFNFI